MDKTALVEGDIDTGRKLVEALDSARFPVSAALWLYTTEWDEWRLLIASPVVDEKGPKKSYAKIRATLSKLPATISIKNVSAVSPKEKLIQLLTKAVYTGPGIAGIRFTRNAVNGEFIEDAYIYRLT
jgi:hypothetical protein